MITLHGIARYSAAFVLFLAMTAHVGGQAPVAPEPAVVAPAAPLPDAPLPMRSLAQEQQALADDYIRLEQKLRRLAQVSTATDPARAALLKRAFAESRERFLAGQLEEMARLLSHRGTDGSPLAYDKVLEGQTKAQSDLKALVELLQAESRAGQAEEERRFLRELGQRLGRIIRSQEGIAGRTESADDAKRLAQDQGDLADRTGELKGDVDEREQKRSEDRESRREGNVPAAPDPDGGDSPPSENDAKPLPDRLQQAQRSMKQAEKRLKESQHKEAAAEQQKALEALKSAQAEIEKILRQMREEHAERTLVALEQRFRAMLDAQIAVYDETKQLDKTPQSQRSAEDDIKAGRLGRREGEIVLMCDRALTLLREDGSTAALPEATEQVRDDMRRVAELLSQSRVDALTQQTEQGVIAALDEILAAVKQAQADAKNEKPSGPMGKGQPGEPGLVDGLAELKMLRTMQAGVNRRLKQFSELTQGNDASDPDVLRGLTDLAQRQKRIVQITRDLVTGKTE